jgi:DNA-binding GntR family transcriptional regulator
MNEVFRETHLISVPVRDKAYEALKEAIIRGSLRAGQRLVETQLAETLNISRTPLREAILKLQSEGFVQRLSSGGTRVRPLSADEVRHLYAIREVLEGLAAREAAERITLEQLERLDQLTRELEAIEASTDVDRIARVGEQFHRIILEAGGNRQLAEHLRQLRDQIQRYRYLTIEVVGRGRAAAGEHTALLEALRKRDPAKAEKVARWHIQRARQSMISRLREINLDVAGS